jgi:hypothetical protein
MHRSGCVAATIIADPDGMPHARHDRAYIYLVMKRQVPATTKLRPAPSPWVRPWRRRVGGALMVGACFALPVAVPQLYLFEWNWSLPGSLELGAILSMLPAAALVALLAPLVSYRRRDGLTMFVPLAGIRVAWIMGTRLGQLPHRNWPTREELIPAQSRQVARIAIAANRYRLWRGSGEQANASASTTAAGET